MYDLIITFFCFFIFSIIVTFLFYDKSIPKQQNIPFNHFKDLNDK
jgi:hypothetical protein